MTLSTLLLGIVVYVFGSGLYAIAETHGIFWMWPWVYRLGPAISRWNGVWNGVRALPTAEVVRNARIVVRWVGDYEVIFRSRASFLRPSVSYKGRLVWNGMEVRATARWFHGFALVLPGFGVIFLYAFGRYASRGDLTHATPFLLGLVIGAFGVFSTIRQGRRDFERDVVDVFSLIGRAGTAAVEHPH